jgi:hypothetical protein
VADSAVLTRASITFQTYDEDKDDDTLLDVTVAMIDGTLVAQVSDFFGTFHDLRENGPYDLELVDPRTRGEMKGGNVTLKISPNGNDTWRFGFFLDLLLTTTPTSSRGRRGSSSATPSGSSRSGSSSHALGVNRTGWWSGRCRRS